MDSAEVTVVVGAAVAAIANLIALYQGGRTEGALTEGLASVASRLEDFTDHLNSITMHQFDRLIDLLEKKTPSP